ncbi:hypothetical protein ABDB91_18080 [Desulfoscipio sp. XC116]|uniref:hypothetical protein n=1 Tax=Desulfoscipio sp. XC116 TaxID=3144975 RepID=UPI00325C067E
MAKKSNEELDSILHSVIRIEILAFFQANPHTRDTADGLALRLHRPRHQVEAALNTLSALGILEIGGTEKVTIYRLRNGDLITNYFKNKRSQGLSKPPLR